MQVEQIPEVACKRARPFERGVVGAPLRPDDEQSRAGSVLPAQHGGRVELLVVKPVGRGRVRFVAIVERCGVRVGQLTQAGVGAFADERLGVELQGEDRRESIVDPAGE